MLEIGILGVAGALLAIQFKGEKSEYGMYIGVGVSLFIFFGILSQMEIFTDTIRQISSYMNLETVYITILLKILGITYVAEFASGICKDAGYQTIASQIEIFGKLAVLGLGVPVLTTLLDTIKEFLS